MKGFLKALILLPVVALVTLFAVANRGPVSIQLDPNGWLGLAPSVSVPLFLVMFACLALGVVLGGAAVWLSQGRHRKAERLHAREVSRLRTEVAELRTRHDTPASSSTELVSSSSIL